jgi:rhodanese-related sulfurtransferase
MIFSGLFSKRATSGGAEISYEDLADALNRGACFVVDVRDPQEFASGHVPGAVNQPLSRSDPKKLPKGKPVVLICQAGGRSAKALSQARSAGHQDVRHYTGGTAGWHARGEKIER